MTCCFLGCLYSIHKPHTLIVDTITWMLKRLNVFWCNVTYSLTKCYQLKLELWLLWLKSNVVRRERKQTSNGDVKICERVLNEFFDKKNIVALQKWHTMNDAEPFIREWYCKILNLRARNAVFIYERQRCQYEAMNENMLWYVNVTCWKSL